MNVERAIKQCSCLNAEAEGSMKRLQEYGRLRSYRKGELIFQEREDVTRFYFVVEGCVALYKMNRNQDRKVIFVYGKGKLLNEVIVEEPVASINACALNDILVLTFPRKQFLEIMQTDYGITKAVLDSSAQKIRRLYHQLANTSNMVSLEQRVAAKLWKLGRDFGIPRGNAIEIGFDMSITFLADMVGAKRESISRCVKKMTEQGMLSREKGRFHLYEMEKLKALVYRSDHP